MNDINTTNPLGQQGRLAQVTAVLINELWKRSSHHPGTNPVASLSKKIAPSGGPSPINAPALTPKTFKDAIGKFNDHFSGNEQHDAQELLAFLLSGLSEDLNCIVEKPYIEAPDSDGRPDRELADIWWSNHLKREMSIIVALFTGQYKSLLTCQSCQYESARFEPFAFLQLPLPEDDQVSVQLVLYPLREKDEPMKYIVRVRHDGTLFDALVSLARVLHADIMEEQQEGSADDVCHRPLHPTTTPRKENREDGDKESSSSSHVSNGAHGRREEDPKTNTIFEQMAQNMDVVRMKESYISNIVPVSVLFPCILKQ